MNRTLNILLPLLLVSFCYAESVESIANTDQIATSSLLTPAVISTNGGLILVRRALADVAGVTNNVGLTTTLTEIDEKCDNGNIQAQNMVNAVNDSRVAEEELGALMEQLYGRRMNVENAINKGRNAAIQQMKIRIERTRMVNSAPQPYGAAGPYAVDQDWRLWAKGYGTRANNDVAGTTVSQDIDVYGTLVGADKSCGKLLLGIAGGYAETDMSQSDGDSSNVRSGFGMVYASIGTEEWFANMSLIYGRNRIDCTVGTAVLGTRADFDADNYAVYIGGGKEIKNDAWTFTPEAAFTVGYYDQEDYVEKARGAGIPAAVDAFSQWSYQSSLGGSVGYIKEFDNNIALVPEVRAYWLHEFDAKDSSQNYRLVNGTQRHSFTVHSPDEDVFEVGAGLSTYLSDSLEIRGDIDMQISDNYEGITVGCRIAYKF